MFLNDCITSELGFDSYYSIIIYCFMLLLTMLTVIYIQRTWNSRYLFPIRELSPLITIFQILGIYIFTIITAANVLLYITGVVYQKTESPETNHSHPSLVLILVNIMLQGRGIFIVASIFKALRIYVAFNFDLKQNTKITRFFSNEIFLLIIIFLIALLWCIVYVVWSILNFDPDFAIKIEQLEIISSISNALEILSCLIICYLNSVFHHKYETFKKYIFLPMLTYCIILEGNSFFQLSMVGDCLLKSIAIAWFICVIRSCIVFYLGIMLPIKNKDDLRMPFTPSSALLALESFLGEEICSRAFMSFLEAKHGDQIELFEYFIDIKVKRDSQQQTNEPSHLLDQLIYGKYWEQVQIKKSLWNSDISRIEFLEEIYQKTYKHFDNIFANDYLKTKSFAYIESLYHGYDRAAENLHQLGMISHITGKVIDKLI